MARHNELGAAGENKAVEYLRSKGYQILHRNWRFQNMELDIVALHGQVLVVVEVKTRSTLAFGLPQDFVKELKIKRILKATNAYIEAFDRQEEVRFDIIAIHKDGLTFKIEHLSDAFYFF